MNRPWPKVFEVSVENNCAFSVSSWTIFSGVLEDPFEEFIVKENKTCKKELVEADLNDKYWQERFTYREEMVPIFLAKHK